MKKVKQRSFLQMENHLHFIRTDEFIIDISDLHREEKLAKFNDISSQEYEYKCCFSDMFTHRSKNLFVVKGKWEMVPDYGPECECDKTPSMLFIEQKWRNVGLFDLFKCEFCKKRKSLKDYYV